MRRIVHKLCSSNRTVLDYKRWISIEVKLYSNITEYNQKRKVKNHKLEHLFLERVKKAFARSLSLYGSDYDLNFRYYVFLKTFPDVFMTTCHQHVRSMIVKFPNNPEVYRLAASWFVRIKNYEGAKKLLLLGQSQHSAYAKIYRDLIEFEFNQHPTTSVMAAKAIINTCVDINKDPDPCFELLSLLGENETYRECVDYLIELMLKKYKDTSMLWNMVALREYKGQFYFEEPLLEAGVLPLIELAMRPSTADDIEDGIVPFRQERENFDSLPGLQEERSISLQSFQRAIQRFKQGLEKTSGKSRNELYEFYLDFLGTVSKGVALRRDFSDWETILRGEYLKLRQQGIKFSENHYRSWFQVSDKVDFPELLKNLRQDVSFPNAPEFVWILYVEYFLTKEYNFEAVTNVLKKVLESRYDLQQVLLTAISHMEVISWEKVIDIYQMAMKCHHEKFSNFFKIRYLRWLIENYGRDKVRSIYREICYDKPLCFELHHEMYRFELPNDEPLLMGAQMEQQQQSLPSRVDRRRSYFHRIVLGHWKAQFKSDPRVYLCQAKSMPPRISNYSEKIRAIYREAEQKLKDQELEEYKREYRKYNTYIHRTHKIPLIPEVVDEVVIIDDDD